MNINPKHFIFFDKFSIQNHHTSTNQTILKDRQTGTLIQVQQIIIQKQQQSIQIIKHLKNQKNIHHQWIVPLLHYYIRKSIKQQSPSKILLFYQHPINNFHQQFKIRKSQKRTFSQTQIWQLLFSVSCAAFYLEQKDIFFKKFKLSDLCITQYKIYQIRLSKLILQQQQFNKQIFYSPQDLQQIQNNLKFSINTYINVSKKQKFIQEGKSGVFSLGICLIKLMLMKSLKKLYNLTSQIYSIKQQTLQEFIQKISKKYSSKLTQIIKKMVKINPQNRLNFHQLKEEVSIYISNLDSSIQLIYKTPQNSRIHQNENQISQKIQQMCSNIENLQNNSLHKDLDLSSHQAGQYYLNQRKKNKKFSHASHISNMSQIRKTITRSTLHSTDHIKRTSLINKNSYINTPKIQSKQLISLQKQKKIMTSQTRKTQTSQQKKRSIIDGKINKNLFNKIPVGFNSNYTRSSNIFNRKAQLHENNIFNSYTNQNLLQYLRKDMNNIIKKRQNSEKKYNSQFQYSPSFFD